MIKNQKINKYFVLSFFLILLGGFLIGCNGIIQETDTYTVSYHGNGNTGGTVPIDNNVYEVGNQVIIIGNTGNLEKTGYTFGGWNTASEQSGTDYAPGEIMLLPASNAILYAKWIPLYALRDIGPAGGLIFYVKAGGYSEGWMYLEAAPSDQSTSATWGCYGTLIPGADGAAVGTGKQNTIDIVAECATVGIAAEICSNLVLGGYSDWFLPSQEELNLMYKNLYNIVTPVGGFADSSYWSSSEESASHACFQYFSTGNQYSSRKHHKHRVRAIRSF